MSENPQEHETPQPDDGPRLTRDRVHEIDQLRRSTSDRYIAGVAGGLGRHFGIDPIVVRVLLVALTLFGGAGLLLYGALWLLVPAEGSDRAAVETPPDTRRVLLLVVAAIAALGLLGDVFGGWGWHFAAPLGLVVLGVAAVLAFSRRGHGRAPSGGDPAGVARPKPEGLVLFWPTVALIVLASGVLGLWSIDHRVAASVWPATALAIVGVMLLVGAFLGRPGGLILVGLLTLPPLAITSAVGSIHWNAGTRTATPTSAAAVGDLHATNGRYVLDLSQVADPQDLSGRTINVSMDAGDLEITLPSTLPTEVNAKLSVAGDIEINGNDDGGLHPQRTELVQPSASAGAIAVPFHLNIHGHLGRIVVTN